MTLPLTQTPLLMIWELLAILSAAAALTSLGGLTIAQLTTDGPVVRRWTISTFISFSVYVASIILICTQVVAG